MWVYDIVIRVKREEKLSMNQVTEEFGHLGEVKSFGWISPEELEKEKQEDEELGRCYDEWLKRQREV